MGTCLPGYVQYFPQASCCGVSTGFGGPPQPPLKFKSKSGLKSKPWHRYRISNSPMLPCAIKCATCGSIFDPARIRRELAAIETKLADPALWSNPNATKPLMRDKKRLETMVADDNALVSRTGDIEAYFELAREGEDVLADLERDIKALASFAEELEAKTMLSSETDPLNAIVTVHPGAGGTES